MSDTPRMDKAMSAWMTIERSADLYEEGCKLEREVAQAKSELERAKQERNESAMRERNKYLSQLTAHKAALEKCEKALTRISNCEDAPPIDATDQIRFGLHCGVEDRCLTSRYEGADYGYQCGTERALDWAIQETTEALSEIAKLKERQ